MEEITIVLKPYKKEDTDSVSTQLIGFYDVKGVEYMVNAIIKKDKQGFILTATLIENAI